MSRSTFSILPYINRQKVKADGTANILCRITVDGKSTAISTGISCTPQEWNAKKGEVRNARDSGRLASFLDFVVTFADEFAGQKGAPAVFCMALGCNNGSHTGAEDLSEYLDYYGSMGELKFAFKRFALMTLLTSMTLTITVLRC